MSPWWTGIRACCADLQDRLDIPYGAGRAIRIPGYLQRAGADDAGMIIAVTSSGQDQHGRLPGTADAVSTHRPKVSACADLAPALFRPEVPRDRCADQPGTAGHDYILR